MKIVLLVLSLIISASASAGAPTPKPLPSGPQRVAERFLAEIERELTGVLAGDDKARARMLGRAADPADLTKALDAFVSRARELKAARAELTGLGVEVVLWFGILPMAHLDIYFWRTPSSLKLLRLTERARQPLWFVSREAAKTTGPFGKAAEALARDIVDRLVAGRCYRLPAIDYADIDPVLPTDLEARKRTRSRLLAFRHRLPGACRRASQTPWNRMTWRLFQVGGVVRTPNGEPHSMALALSMSPHGQVQVLGLTPPVVAPGP